MNSNVLVLLSTPCLSMATMAQTSAKNRGGFSSNGTAEAEVRALMAERRNASIAGDTETIINSTADAYLQTDIKGYRQDKATWLNQYFKPLADLIKAGKFRWEVYDHKDLQFRIFGDCAIVTGSLELKGSGARFGPQHAWVADPTANLGATLHFTHVYIKQDGKWLLAGLHNQMPLSNPQE